MGNEMTPESGGSEKKEFMKKGPRPPRVSRDKDEEQAATKKVRPSAGRKKAAPQPKPPVKPEKPAAEEAAVTPEEIQREKPKKKKEKKKKEKKEKKPLFGRKSKAAVTAAAVEAGEASAEEAGEGEKKEKKPRFGRKGGKKEKESGKSKPKTKAKRGGGIGGSKMSAVGLDIGRTSLTATRLKHQTGGSSLLQAALDKLPEGLISEGEVKDVEALAFALKDFWKTHKIKGRRVSLGLANQKVVVRALDFPILEEKELKSAIEFQAQDYIPIPAEEAVFAHHIVGKVVDEDGVEMQKVLVVAAQKEMVMDFVNAIKRAKLVVDSIDLQAFAMMRSMRTASFFSQDGVNEAIAIANIASDITNIVIDVGGDPQFTRIISFGGDDFTKSVAEHQGLKFEEAEVLKIKAGLPEPGTSVPAMEMEKGPGEGVQSFDEMGPEDLPFRPTGPEGEAPEAQGHEVNPEQGQGPAEGEPQPHGFGPPDERLQREGGEDEPALSEEERIAQVQRVLEVTAETLADELRRSFDYYMSQETAAPISMLLLSGGGALMPNLEKHLSQMFPFEVRMGDPTAQIVENRSDLTDEELKVLGPRLAIAIGLSMEDEGS